MLYHLTNGNCIILILINNCSSLNKGNRDCDGVSDLNWHILLCFYFSIFSLVLVSIKKMYQALKTVFDHISKHLKVCSKTLHCTLYFQLSSRCLVMWSNMAFVFDKLLETYKGEINC